MKLLLAAVLLALVWPASAAGFSIPGTGVAFDAPDGFTSLAKDEITRKYPSGQAPGYVVGNGRRTTSIAYDLKEQALPADKLAEVKTAFEQLFERVIPGIAWIDRRIVRMQNQDWIQLELSSRAIDTDIHNIMLVTPHRGKMLIFNFNSTKGEFASMERALRKSIASISLKN